MRFEERLALTVASVIGLALLNACGNGGGNGIEKELEEMCDGAPAPEEGFRVIEGWVEVPLGADCPDPETAEPKYYGCAFTDWQGINCGNVRKEPNMVYINDGYGGHHEPADEQTTTGTGYVGEAIDLCWYEGVYFTDPNPSYTCGRPLLHEGAMVVAPVVAAAGWSEGAHPVLAGLSDAQREQLLAHWLDSAVMEHASVASFARVTLDLMRFGAPPALLEATQRAASDEITHARLCFALASAYAGQPLAPGALNAPAEQPATLADFAEALVREGCVGETLAAVDAAARLAEARDPAVRAALEAIVRDESDHAALAWRTLRWVLDQDADGAVRTRVAAVFAEERDRWMADEPSVPVEPELRAHGLLDPARRAAALKQAWTDVVQPSWEALA